MKYTGGCHCGSIEIEFATTRGPSEIEVRACQCSFCLKHNSRAVADPEGRAVIRAVTPAHVVLYEFGLKTARYVLCGNCGVYVAAITSEEPMRAIIIVSALDDAKSFSNAPRPVDYDAEDREARLARRRSRWMPAALTGIA